MSAVVHTNACSNTGIGVRIKTSLRKKGTARLCILCLFLCLLRYSEKVEAGLVAGS